MGSRSDSSTHDRSCPRRSSREGRHKSKENGQRSGRSKLPSTDSSRRTKPKQDKRKARRSSSTSVHSQHRRRSLSNKRSKPSRKTSRSRSAYRRARSTSHKRKRRPRSSTDEASQSRERKKLRPTKFSAGSDEQGASALEQYRQHVMAQNAAHLNAIGQGGKVQREVYVGNLALGTTEAMLEEFFNATLRMQHPSDLNPVLRVALNGDGKYGFVEMRSTELATAAMAFDTVELLGRRLRVSRPNGYVPMPEPKTKSSPVQATASLGMAATSGQANTGARHKTICLENMVTKEDVAGEDYQEIVDEIKKECGKFGTVDQIFVPRPDDVGFGRAFVRFFTPQGAAQASAALTGRKFDGREVAAKLIEDRCWDLLAKKIA